MQLWQHLALDPKCSCQSKCCLSQVARGVKFTSNGLNLCQTPPRWPLYTVAQPTQVPPNSPKVVSYGGDPILTPLTLGLKFYLIPPW